MNTVTVPEDVAARLRDVVLWEAAWRADLPLPDPTFDVVAAAGQLLGAARDEACAILDLPCCGDEGERARWAIWHAATDAGLGPAVVAAHQWMRGVEAALLEELAERFGGEVTPGGSHGNLAVRPGGIVRLPQVDAVREAVWACLDVEVVRGCR